LALIDAGAGIDSVFEDVTELLGNCRFRDCSHQTEPGCAVRQAINEGLLDEARLHRWQKLKLEDRYSTETAAEARERQRRFGKQVKTSLSVKSRLDKR
jgi:ribosome biogenesis GTPase / thiamine phosphate phosphatase